jgi:predicted Zn-dependent protease
MKPDTQDEAALLRRIDQALDEGDLDKALAQCVAGRDLHHDSPAFCRKYATTLIRAGRADAARAILAPLHVVLPLHTGIALDLAGALRTLGQIDEAETVFHHILAHEPGNQWAEGGLAQLSLDRGDADGALARTHRALAAEPDSIFLKRKLAAVLTRAGRPVEARDLLAELHRDRPDHSDIAMDYAATLRGLGDLDGAGAAFGRVLETQPGNDWAQAGLIQILLDRNDPRAALAQCEAALVNRPDSIPLRRKKAAALRRTGRTEAARDLLAKLHRDRPDETNIAQELASVLRGLGQLDEADTILMHVLQREPQSRTARLARAAVAEARGNVDAALELLEGGLDFTLARAELLMGAGRPDAARTLVSGLAARPASMPDEELVGLIRLLDRLQVHDARDALTDHIKRRTAMSAHLALAVLRSVHSNDNRDTVLKIAHQLAPCVAPEKRDVFRAETAMLLHGPFAALSGLRVRKTKRSDPMQAATLGRILLACGRTGLALRYLMRCARHWPDAAAIRSNLVAAFIANGQPDRAGVWLDGHADRIDPTELAELRLSIAMETGALDTAIDLFEQLVRCGRRRRGAGHHLRAVLALGRLEEAEVIAAAAKHDPLLSPSQAAHFSISQIGAILTELRLYRLAATDIGDNRPDDTLIADNFCAAQRVLDRWLDGPIRAASPTAQTVPRRILQYWDSPTLPPDMAQVVQSWRDKPGWTHVILDRSGARQWLAATLGADHVRAFDLAKNPAEESDFLRLCLLLVDGGIYADTDDVLTGQPEGLLQEGSGLVLFREPFGAIANNVICAPPGHPALHIAATMAKDALIRRDTDSTWLKTGPGLLTRAVARHLDQARTDPEISIAPQWRLLRHVKPHVPFAYKRTCQYWNRISAPMSAPRRPKRRTTFA